jgi:hypothetical protein
MVNIYLHVVQHYLANLLHTYTGCPKKKYSGLILNNSEASEAITLKYISLDRGKANLDFDILQLYIYKKPTEISGPDILSCVSYHHCR